MKKLAREKREKSLSYFQNIQKIHRKEIGSEVVAFRKLTKVINKYKVDSLGHHLTPHLSNSHQLQLRRDHLNEGQTCVSFNDLIKQHHR